MANLKFFEVNDFILFYFCEEKDQNGEIVQMAFPS